MLQHVFQVERFLKGTNGSLLSLCLIQIWIHKTYIHNYEFKTCSKFSYQHPSEVQVKFKSCLEAFL